MEKTTRQKIVGRWLVFAGGEGAAELFKNILEKPLDRCLTLCYNGIANKKNHSDNWNSLSVDRGICLHQKTFIREGGNICFGSNQRKNRQTAKRLYGFAMAARFNSYQSSGSTIIIQEDEGYSRTSEFRRHLSRQDSISVLL